MSSIKNLKRLLRLTLPHLECNADLTEDEVWNPDSPGLAKEIRDLVKEIRTETLQWTDMDAPEVKEEDKDVHTEHCCIIHGCKYDNNECPVENKVKKQSFPCEMCDLYD